MSSRRQSKNIAYNFPPLNIQFGHIRFRKVKHSCAGSPRVQVTRIHMEKLLNVENDWDGEVDCPEVMGPCCLISEEDVVADIK